MMKKAYKRIYQRYTQSDGLRKIIPNIGWLLGDKILRMGVGLVVGVWIARYFGPEQYGIWNYAIAFSSIFGAFATLGLDNIVIREIVKDSSRRDVLLGSAFRMKLLAGITTLFVTVIAIYFIKPEDRLTLYLVALSSVGFVFQSFYVIDFYFQSQVKSKYTVYANNASFISIALVKIILLLLQCSLLAFAIVGAMEILLSSILLIKAYNHNHLYIFDWKYDGTVVKNLLKDSWPLFLSGLSIMIYMRIDQVMIGNMLGDRAVGIYSAAVKISEIWYFIPIALVSSLFPVIIESKKISEELYYTRLQKLINMMTLIGFTAAIVLTFLSGYVVKLLYGLSYADSASVLSLHIWAGLFVCLGITSSSWVMIENLQKYIIYTTTAGCIANIILNFFLIPIYGVNGAALATVISQIISVFSIILFKKTRIIGLMMLKSFSLKNGIIDFKI